MNPPTVDRFRYPWRRLVPGDTHTIVLQWADGLNVAGSTFTVAMLDAFTATAVAGVTYTVSMTNAATGKVTATAPIPSNIPTGSSYEIRVIQNGDTIIAGPVLFASTVVPV